MAILINESDVAQVKKALADDAKIAIEQNHTC
jgi:hypothetical protein